MIDNGSNIVKAFKILISNEIIKKSVDKIIKDVANGTLFNFENVSFADENESDNCTNGKDLINDINEFDSIEAECNNYFSSYRKNFRMSCNAHSLQLAVN